MTKLLRIASDLSLALDAVTQTYLIVGKRGSGKSNTAARLVEQLHRASIPFVVLDPTDTWWGLKAARDGGPGLAGVYVFGGRKADMPLEAGGGALIAEMLCEHRMSIVLSVKHLSGRARSTFMVDFARTLFQKWNGGPLHVVLEEAHELAPQSSMNAREGEQEMLGAFKRLWKLGRSSGIGGSAITQRPASLSKDITTQSEILIAHRTIGPQDVKAIGEWVKYHGEHEDILADLPTLPSGEAFVWAPEFPEGNPIGLKRVKILLRDTYDSASTPKVGEHRVEPKELAAVDMERLRVKMAATIERAKADDPKELRKEIAALKHQLASAPIQTPLVDHRAIDRAVAEAVRAEQTRYFKLVRRAEAVIDSMDRATTGLLAGAKMLRDTIDEIDEERKTAVDSRADAQVGHTQRGTGANQPTVKTGGQQSRSATRPPVASRPDSELSPGAQKLLNAAAKFASMNIDTPTRTQVAALAPMSPTSSATERYFAEAIRRGHFDTPETGAVRLTQSGHAAAATVETPPTLTEYVTEWRRLLGEASERKLYDAMLEEAGDVARNVLAERASISPTSSATERAFAWLIGLDLLEKAGIGMVKPGRTMFPAGLS